MTARIKNHPLIFIFIFGAIIYLIAYAYTLGHLDIALAGDAGEYLKVAENFTKHGTFYCGDLNETINPDLYSRRLFLYPLWIAIFRHVPLILFFQIILSMITGLLIMRILKFQKVKRKWIAAVLILFFLYPSQIIFTQMLMSEIFLQTLLVCAFYFLLLYVRRMKFIHLFVCNLFIAGAVATKPSLLYFWIPNVLLHICLFLKYRKTVILAFPLLMILVISLWSYRNDRLTGVYHYSSIKKHNVLNYNVRSFLIKRYDRETADRTIAAIETAAAEKGTYRAAYHEIENESWKIIKQHWLKYSIHHLQGGLNFFLDPGRFEIYNFFRVESSGSLFVLYTLSGYKGLIEYIKSAPELFVFMLLVTGVINLLLFISLIYFILKLPGEVVFNIYIVLICMYVVIVTGPIGASRFRLPVFPFLAMTLPFMAEWVSQRIQVCSRSATV